jgi:membrane protein DedA with SNARE-associated domain
VISAGVFEMRPYLFLLSIFSGRVIRFLLLGALVVKFGPGIVILVTAVMTRHLPWVLVGLAAIIAIIVSHMRFRKSRARDNAGPEAA